MRNASKYFITAILAVMTLTSCGNDDNDPGVVCRKDYPDFTATIAAAQSRAFDRSWERGDRIGISGAGRTNVSHLTAAGDGRFTVETSGEQIYFQDENEVTFTAYYPWSADAIKADTRVQTDQKSFDYLWAQATGKKDAPNVTFTFSHCMAKVLLTLRPGEGMSFDEVKAATLSLGGFRHSGSFNTADGSTTLTGDATAKWVFSGGVAAASVNDTDRTLTYSFIVFPQTHAAPLAFLAELALTGDNTYNLRADIDFTGANAEKDGADANNEWVAGRQYNLTLTLNKTDVSLDRCEIIPWVEVNGGEISVD